MKETIHRWVTPQTFWEMENKTKYNVNLCSKADKLQLRTQPWLEHEGIVIRLSEDSEVL